VLRTHHGVEEYMQTFSGTHFSHGICPDCYQKVARPEMLKSLKRE